MTTSARLLLALGLLLFAADAIAVYTVNGQRKSFEIRRTDSPPVIDGKLDDAVWQDTVGIDDFHQTVPTYGAAPTEQTISSGACLCPPRRRADSSAIASSRGAMPRTRV